MIFLFGGLLVAWLALHALRTSRTARRPPDLARLMRGGGGWALIVLALLVLLRGRPEFALGFGGVGLWLLATTASGRRAASPRPTGPSRSALLRTAMIEMEADARGPVRGVVLAGPWEGVSLDALSGEECRSVLAICRTHDPDGARLLEAYLDRRFTGGRSAGEGQRDARRTGRDERVRPGSMSKDEAYEVLGLQKSATREEVVRAHRTLIKKLHPDQGGSTDLAARVNAAKEVLMRRDEGWET